MYRRLSRRIDPIATTRFRRNLQRAAEQRSELSPGRGFASPGYCLVRLAEPRSGDRESVNKLGLITGKLCRPSGLDQP